VLLAIFCRIGIIIAASLAYGSFPIVLFLRLPATVMRE
jgi:hypothetical protein